MGQFRVMRAATLTKPVKFPVLASPKIDGIRAIVRDGMLMTQSLKPVPNKFIQSSVNWADYEGLDGELVVGSPTDANVMQATQSGVMSEEGEPDWHYWCFDMWTDDQRYDLRFESLKNYTNSSFGHQKIHLLLQREIDDTKELWEYENSIIELGYEGVMLRNPNGLYKYGRSTENEGYLVKMKRFQDAEATILYSIPLMTNNNPAKTNNLGLTERSSAKEGLVAKNLLGALHVVNDEGVEFDIGTGFTDEQRHGYWRDKEILIGRRVKFKFFNGGVKVAPRFPVFLGLRYD